LKAIVGVAIAGLVLGACSSAGEPTTREAALGGRASAERTDLLKANLRVQDFPEGTVIVSQPHMASHVRSEVSVEPPGVSIVHSRVVLRLSPSRAAAAVADGCIATPEAAYPVFDGEVVVSPNIGDVSRAERWRWSSGTHLFTVCFSVSNLWGGVEAHDVETAFEYARLLHGRMTAELRHPSWPTRPPGRELWRFETGYHTVSSPAVADGVVYVGSLDTFLYAVAASTGLGQP